MYAIIDFIGMVGFTILVAYVVGFVIVLAKGIVEGIFSALSFLFKKTFQSQEK